MLARVRSPRVRRSIASVLRENLDPATSVVGIDVKVLAGAIFAEIVRDDHLADDVRALARRAGVDRRRLDAALAVARGDDPLLRADDRKAFAALTLARDASHSPAGIDATTIAACRDGGLSPAAIVEIIAWLSVLQMLHRLTCFALVTD